MSFSYGQAGSPLLRWAPSLCFHRIETGESPRSIVVFLGFATVPSKLKEQCRLDLMIGTWMMGPSLGLQKVSKALGFLISLSDLSGLRLNLRKSLLFWPLARLWATFLGFLRAALSLGGAWGFLSRNLVSLYRTSCLWILGGDSGLVCFAPAAHQGAEPFLVLFPSFHFPLSPPEASPAHDASLRPADLLPGWTQGRSTCLYVNGCPLLSAPLWVLGWILRPFLRLFPRSWPSTSPVSFLPLDTKNTTVKCL